jgi:hypothetical protein
MALREHDHQTLLPATAVTGNTIANTSTNADTDNGGYSTICIFATIDSLTGGDNYTLQVQHSADGANWVDISGANFGGAISVDGYNCQLISQFAGYIRVSYVGNDAGAGCTLTITAHFKS